MDRCGEDSRHQIGKILYCLFFSLFVALSFHQKVLMPCLSSLCLLPSQFPSVSPLRPRCPCPGNRLFMSIPTGNPLMNVTVCSEIKHLESPWKGLRDNSKLAYPRVLSFFVVFSCFVIKTGLNRTSASTRAGLHFLALFLSFVMFKERARKRPAGQGL